MIMASTTRGGPRIQQAVEPEPSLASSSAMAEQASPHIRTTDADAVSFSSAAIDHVVLGAADAALLELDGAADTFLAETRAGAAVQEVPPPVWDRLTTAAQQAGTSSERLALHLAQAGAAGRDMEQIVVPARAIANHALASLRTVSSAVAALPAIAGSTGRPEGEGHHADPLARLAARETDPRSIVPSVPDDVLVRADVLQSSITTALGQTRNLLRRLDGVADGLTGHRVLAGNTASAGGRVPGASCPMILYWLPRLACLMLGLWLLHGIDRPPIRLLASTLTAGLASFWLRRWIRPRTPSADPAKVDCTSVASDGLSASSVSTPR